MNIIPALTATTRRLRTRVGAVVGTTALALGAFALFAPAASAATVPASYALSFNACTRVQDGTSVVGYMYTSRPVAVAHYTGTTELYWDGTVQVDIKGTWQNLESVGSAYATVWGAQGTSLTPINWGNQANNYGVVAGLPNGYSYRVIGYTYWWTGKAWSVSNATLVTMCNF
jgi:hypothetical protein